MRTPGAKRGRALAAGALGMVLLIALLCALHEPHYQGKSVTQWTQQLQIAVKVFAGPDGTYTVILPNLSDEQLAHLQVSPKIRGITSNTMMCRFFTNWPDQVDFGRLDALQNDPAARAISHFGARALPALQAGLHCEDSMLRNAFCQWLWPRLPIRCRPWVGRPIHPIHMRVNSAYGLGLLGPAAAAAAADLQRLATHDADCLVRSVAVESLHRIQGSAAGPFYPELFSVVPPLSSSPESNTNSLKYFSNKLSL